MCRLCTSVWTVKWKHRYVRATLTGDKVALHNTVTHWWGESPVSVALTYPCCNCTVHTLLQSLHRQKHRVQHTGLMENMVPPSQTGPHKSIRVIKGGGPSAHYSTQLLNDQEHNSSWWGPNGYDIRHVYLALASLSIM